MITRQFIIAAAAIATTVAACADGAGESTPAAGVDSAVTSTTGGAPGGDSGSASTIVPTGVALDSVPVRTPEGKPARFGVRSGIIRLRYTGDITGIRVITFDHWGISEARLDSAAPIPGKKGPVQNITFIATENSFIQLDHDLKKGWTAPNQSLQIYLNSDSGKTFSLAEMVFRNSGGRRLPDTQVLGRTTKVLQLDQGFGSTKVHVWQGIILKEEFASVEGTRYTVEAESIELDVPIPETAFQAPPSYPITKRQRPPMPGEDPYGKGPQMPPNSGMMAPPGGVPPGMQRPGGAPPVMPPMGK